MKLFIMNFIFLAPIFFLCSCTYNISMSHTSGGSTETMEDTASNTPNVSPNINIPLTPNLPLGITK